MKWAPLAASGLARPVRVWPLPIRRDRRTRDDPPLYKNPRLSSSPRRRLCFLSSSPSRSLARPMFLFSFDPCGAALPCRAALPRLRFPSASWDFLAPPRPTSFFPPSPPLPPTTSPLSRIASPRSPALCGQLALRSVQTFFWP